VTRNCTAAGIIPGFCRTAFITAALLTLAACASSRVSDGPQSGSAIPPDLPGDAIPRKEPRSRYGNPPVYEVMGKRYTVMNTSYGYQERGVASWYGSKFHGRQTSSQEPYDMYAMTAAPKTLPLPTYVRVRNLRNDRSVVVRINDRGPFVDNRIIDLSYSAAARLDMIRDGTSLVEVTALSFDEPPAGPSGDVPTRSRITAPASHGEAVPPAQPVVATAEAEPREHEVFVQVGAFGDIENAKRRYSLLRMNGVSRAFVHKDESLSPALYRIRIGPIMEVEQYDALVIHLANLGIADSHLVAD
jgi:rare lipoprotein A